MNLPTLLGLLTAPGELTLDVACGEGRVARELLARGHAVVGIEGSPELAAAAMQADPTFEVHVADAAQIPLPDNHVDLAVASLSLMNMDDMPTAIREIGRVLRPGCALCFSILHPINSWGDAGTASYFETVRYSEELRADGARLRLHETHRPVGHYFAALENAGFLVQQLVEPVPDDAYLAVRPEAERWRRRPGFLHVRAVLCGV
jgi:ubiquinone/menaquinone biosynthesis C-methylase UbiE